MPPRKKPKLSKPSEKLKQPTIIDGFKKQKSLPKDNSLEDKAPNCGKQRIVLSAINFVKIITYCCETRGKQATIHQLTTM